MKLARVCRHPAQRHLVTQQKWVYSDLSPHLRFLTALLGPGMLLLSHLARAWVLVPDRGVFVDQEEGVPTGCADNRMALVDDHPHSTI